MKRYTIKILIALGILDLVGIIGMGIRKLVYYTDMTASRYFLENWETYGVLAVILIGLRVYAEFK